ncbi:MAG: 23S rRNA (adenine(2503)-C(2))-methyltransferase RlmN [Bacilli bacterium]|jgi:23S rRNA (adenine2503-C2)-methyltransferase|nr:23S rRNA (adenine(2503)-C(2))-methyltransferase RlmN [Bacilli bacterium]
MKENLFNKTREELENYFISIGEKKFKALQVYEWLYEKREFNIDNFSNIKKEIREQLKKDFSTDIINIEKKQEDNLTKKYLFKLLDGEFIEAVVMEHDYGTSICVSSEVGCNMACKFCESGRQKKIRNLEAYEIVEQILAIEQDLQKRLSSVVIMGIGEPLDNYENIIKFIKIINDPKGIAIGARHITLSTCGLVPKIYELSKLPLQINLAISLHASNNALRDKLMPVNKVYNIDNLLQAIKDYLQATSRRVTIEYVMLDNVNDSKANALELANLFKGMNIYVNLIPYNETNHLEFKRSSKNKILAFYDTLKKSNINCTIRREFGSNIDAACGQLRGKQKDS